MDPPRPRTDNLPALLLATLRRHQTPLLLGWLVLVHLVVTLIYLHMDWYNVDRVADEEEHYISAMNLYLALKLGGFESVLLALRLLYNNYVSVAHLPQVAAGMLFGPTPMALRAGNVVYFVVLLVSVYKIGRLCQSRRAGLLSAALVGMMPAVYGGWRTLGLDFPALCLTPLAFYYLLRCEGFSRTRESALFGVTCGFAVLAKGQVLLFLACPAALLFGRELLARWRRRDLAALRGTLARAGLALGVLALTTSIWWFGRLGHMAGNLLVHTTGEGMKVAVEDPSLWGGIRHYVLTFPLLISGPALAALVLVSLAFFRRTRQRWEILLWLLVPLGLHMSLAVREHRYLFPLVPAAALVLGIGISSLRPRLRALAAAAVGCALFIGWLDCSLTLARDPSMPVQPLRITCRTHNGPHLTWGSYLLACGDREYAGHPWAAGDQFTLSSSLSLVSMIERDHPDGRGAIIFSDRGRRMGQVLLTAQTLLPEMIPVYSIPVARKLLKDRQLSGYRSYIIHGSWKEMTVVPMDRWPGRAD